MRVLFNELLNALERYTEQLACITQRDVGLLDQRFGRRAKLRGRGLLRLACLSSGSSRSFDGTSHACVEPNPIDQFYIVRIVIKQAERLADSLPRLGESLALGVTAGHTLDPSEPIAILVSLVVNDVGFACSTHALPSGSTRRPPVTRLRGRSSL